MPVLSLAMQRKTGLFLTDNDEVGPAERATVFHYLENDGLQKLVFDTLRSKGFDLIRVVPEADENGYLRVAFFVSPPSERTHGNEVLTGGMISA